MKFEFHVHHENWNKEPYQIYIQYMYWIFHNFKNKLPIYIFPKLPVLKKFPVYLLQDNTHLLPFQNMYETERQRTGSRRWRQAYIRWIRRQDFGKRQVLCVFRCAGQLTMSPGLSAKPPVSSSWQARINVRSLALSIQWILPMIFSDARTHHE